MLILRYPFHHITTTPIVITYPTIEASHDPIHICSPSFETLHRILSQHGVQVSAYRMTHRTVPRPCKETIR